MSNLFFLDRFDGGLANWATHTGGGSVSVDYMSYSYKLALHDTSTSDNVSATATFAFPAQKYIVEADMYSPIGGSCVCELLSAAGAVLVSGEVFANTLACSTDTVGATSVTWADATYNQLTLVVDPVGNTVRFYWYNRAYAYSPNDPLQQAAQLAFSGAAVAAIRFRTNTATTGTAYVDEVKVFTPEWCTVGDSISQGLPFWCNDPNTSWRTSSSNDQADPPQYQLGTLLGSNNWCSGRGWGGSFMSELVSLAQSLIVDQGFTDVWINSGHNDIIFLGATDTTLASDMTSIVNTLTAAGISTNRIHIDTIYGTAWFNTSALKTYRANYNTWLANFCAATGCRFVNTDASITNYGASPPEPYSGYNSGDNVHLNKTGYGVMAQLAFNSIYKTSSYSFGGII